MSIKEELLNYATDVEFLSNRSVEIDPEEEGEFLNDVVSELKQIVERDNLASLSAPQIGILCRVAVVNFNGDIREFIDSDIVNCGSGLIMSVEEDPCIPGKRFMLPRYNQITIQYLDTKKEAHSVSLSGLAAYAMQQAQDHLEGVLISDVGIELPENYDNFTDDEKIEFAEKYRNELIFLQQKVDEEIKEDEVLSNIKEMEDFYVAMQTGKIEATFLTDEEIEKMKNDGSEVHSNEPAADSKETEADE